MILYAYPDRLSNLAIEAFGKYISNFLRQLVMYPFRRRKNLDRFYYINPCNQLKELIRTLVPPTLAEEVSVKLLRHLDFTYRELEITKRLRRYCNVLAPEVLDAILHPSAMKLLCYGNKMHLSLINIYEVRDCKLIYICLERLQGLEALALGGASNCVHSMFNERNLTHTLREFSCSNCWDEELYVLSEICTNMKILNISHSFQITDRSVPSILKFRNLEELYIDCKRLSQAGLTEIINGMSQIEIKLSDNTSVCASMLLKSFACYNPTHNNLSVLAEKFENLTFLSINKMTNMEVTDLSRLKYLRKLSLSCLPFDVVNDLLQELGRQLLSLHLSQIDDIDFTVINEKCPSLQCFGISSKNWLLSDLPIGECSTLELHEKYPIPEFESVECLHLSSATVELAVYILSKFVNVTHLHMKYSKDVLEHVLHLKKLRFLVQEFWSYVDIVEFFEGFAVVTQRSLSDANIRVRSIVT